MEIFREYTQPLYLKVYHNRALHDADATPVVALSLNGIALPAHTVVREDAGVYSVQLSFSDIAEEGELKAVWQYSINGETITKTEVHSVVTPYVDMGYLYELDQPEDQQLFAERYARYAIERFTGQSFGKRHDWKKVSGSGTDSLVLPERIISPEAIYENGAVVWDYQSASNVIGDIEIAGSKFGLRCVAQEDPLEYYASSRLSRGGAFVDGYTYEVVGLYGYEYVPDDILLCGQMLVDDYFCKDRAWKEKWAVRIKSGDMAVDLDQRVFSGTGNAYVDAILDDYTWHRMVII